MRFTNRTNLISAEEQRKRNLAMRKPPHLEAGDKVVGLGQTATTLNTIKLALFGEHTNRK